jgi:hypothetical protein
MVLPLKYKIWTELSYCWIFHITAKTVKTADYIHKTIYELLMIILKLMLIDIWVAHKSSSISNIRSGQNCYPIEYSTLLQKLAKQQIIFTKLFTNLLRSFLSIWRSAFEWSFNSFPSQILDFERSLIMWNILPLCTNLTNKPGLYSQIYLRTSYDHS